MDPYGPPLKKLRHDIFPSVNGAYKGRGVPGDLDTKFFSSPDARYRPLDGFLSERESLSTGLGGKSKACLKFFSTSGCPYGERCHFAHYIPGGVAALGLAQNSNLSIGTLGTKKDPSGSSLEHSSFSGGFKTRMCNNFSTSEGCRFGDKCHFAHGEREMRKSNGPVLPVERDLDKFTSLGRTSGGGPIDGRFGGSRGHREPTPPGLAAAASFGASSTAKISIDASLAGAIIGKGGVNAKTICRITGAKLSIREHETDTSLRNIEMEGSFDQIKQASGMVRELLMQKDIVPTKPGNFGAHNYKTKLCETHAQGNCTFGDRCHFAHGSNELRQP